MIVQKSSDRLNWDDLRYFSALADTNRISAAASRLGVNHVTVSRRIDRLEESLNLKLFSRSNDGYSLTLEGDELLKRVETISPVLEQIATPSDETGLVKKSVKVSMVHSIAEVIAVPALCELQKEHPNLELEVDTSSRNVSIVKRESDIALRLALPESGEYLTRRLANINYVLCGTDALATLCENRQSVPMITYTQALSKLPEAKYLRDHFGIDNIALQTDSATVQRAAAIAGTGIALLPRYLFDTSGLKAIAMKEPVHRELWLLTRKDKSQLSEVRLIIDSLAHVFQSMEKSASL